MSLTKITTEVSGTIFSLPYLVAQEKGYFTEEGLDVEFTSSPHRPSAFKAIEDHELVSSFGHFSSFEDGKSSLYRACEWGQIRRTHDGQRGGRIISKRAAVASQAILVRPDSDISHPQGLASKSVAVNFHHGSHYVAIQSLEGFLEPDEIKVVHLGGPQERFEALRDGRADAAALMEPWISVAEKLGYKVITEAYYVGSEIASDDISAETYEALNRAIVKAVRDLQADPRPYVHHLIESVPAGFVDLEVDDFPVGRLRYVDPAPYPVEEFDRTYRWLVRWGLIPDGDDFTAIVDNRIAAAV